MTMKRYGPDAQIRLFLVEDDRESGEAVRVILKKRGLVVGLARNAEEALERFSPADWDVIVADIRLGGMSGVDLLRRVRIDHPDFPVILLTGFDSLDTAIQAVRLGAHDYILKPLEQIEDLLLPVRKAVRNYRALIRSRVLEDKLRISEAKFRAVLENSQDIAFRIDLERRALDYVSPSVRGTLGRSEESFAGLDLAAVMDLIHPDDRRRMIECIAVLDRAIQAGEDASASVECRVRHSEGTYLWLSVVHAVEMGSGNGRPAGIIGNARDITEKKAAQEREKSFQERMARVERMEALSVLAGGVAHDLNNILCSVSIRPRLLLEQLKERGGLKDSEAIREDLTVVSDAALRAGDVVQDLLTLSRRGNYKFRPVDLNLVIRRYIRSPAFRHMSDADPRTIICQDLETGLPPVKGSAAHLEQVVMNLVINAFEAMKNGGHLQIKTSHIYVATEVQGYEIVEPGEYVLFQVADSGDGIRKEDLDRIFEPFYSKKKMGQQSGTGLGLAIVHGVTKDHGGFLDVRTEVGAGTVFDIYLPIASMPVETERDANLELLAGSGDILVVDDEAEQLELGRQALSQLGYRVATASNGREAVDIFKRRAAASSAEARKQPFDLIMLDMVLEEDFDGLDTYREIVGICPGQKCVIVSGFAKNDRVAEARALGAGPFVSKPYNVETLASAVQGEINR